MVAAEPITPHVRLIRAPIGAAFVALYLIVGRRVSLVDTGFAYHPRQSIDPALATLGLTLRDIDLILTTHGHLDHVGGHATVVSASGAPVAIHSADRGRLTGPSAPSIGRDEFAAALRRLGLEDRATEREAFVLEATPGDIEVVRLLNDGDRIDLGSSVVVEVVGTPGHTDGSVSFIVRPDDIALVGDAIQGQGGSEGLPLYEDPDAYGASLARIVEAGVSQAGLGHAFRSAHIEKQWPIATGTALSSLVRESGSFPVIAADTASDVVAMGLPSIHDAVGEFLRRLPPPFDTRVLDPDTAGAATLHAALLHLGRAAIEATGDRS